MNEKGTDVEIFEARGDEKTKIIEPTNQAPASMYELTLAQGGDLEKLEKFMELQTKWEEREAKKAFTKAMAAFKADPPEIQKDKENVQFDSMYTSIGELVNKATPELSKYGFSHNWDYGKTEDGNPEVTCILTHELGHSISVTQDSPLIISKNREGKEVTNLLQQVKCTHTYLKILTFEAVTGLVSKDANLDDDGNAAGKTEETKYITDVMKKEIEDFIKATKTKKAEFLKYIKAKSIEEIPLTEYGKVIAAFQIKEDIMIKAEAKKKE